MFCYQCEQTANGKGCSSIGVCGKDASTSALQDLLLFGSKGVSRLAVRLNRQGEPTNAADRFVVESLFTTVTNVNFDPTRLEQWIRRLVEIRADLLKRYAATPGAAAEPASSLGPTVNTSFADDLAGLTAQGAEIGILSRLPDRGADALGLEELITYGLKGMAAYADHAWILGSSDPSVFAFFHEALDFLCADRSLSELTAFALRVGETNLRVMELLDAANTGTYGHPEPTRIRISARKGKAILVSGHDLKDLEELLKQTAGQGINVYTHGEMLPANAYPELKKYAHLAGNYGGAWQDQRKEFDAFPGAILMTTNCIQRPKETYYGRIFTSGLVAWPGVVHIDDRNFAPVIEAALSAPGFAEDEPERFILGGFGRQAVLSVAPQVIEAVKSGAIRRFYLIGGCDGAKSGRNYYTDLATRVPKDCVILTLACGKFRFNKLEFGEIGGIPRLLDIGQCNDAYSAIKIAQALGDAFGVGVNDLPLSMVLSWYEQKAVVILLSLLHLGIRNIRLGPTLPAFVTPAVLDVLVQNFGIKPISTVESDLEATLAGA